MIQKTELFIWTITLKWKQHRKVITDDSDSWIRNRNILLSGTVLKKQQFFNADDHCAADFVSDDVLKQTDVLSGNRVYASAMAEIQRQTDVEQLKEKIETTIVTPVVNQLNSRHIGENAHN